MCEIKVVNKLCGGDKMTNTNNTASVLNYTKVPEKSV